MIQSSVKKLVSRRNPAQSDRQVLASSSSAFLDDATIDITHQLHSQETNTINNDDSGDEAFKEVMGQNCHNLRGNSSHTSSMRSTHPMFPRRLSRMNIPHTANINSHSFSSSREPHGRKTVKLGKPIPVFMLKIIRFLLGIRTDSNKRTYPGIVFNLLTIGIGAGFIITSLIYNHQDIVSDFTKTTVVDGTITCLFIIVWCCLGVYANGLAYRLYSSDQFKPLIRMPSKKILGINSTITFLVLLLFTLAINDYSGRWMYTSTNCDKFMVSPLIACRLRYVLRVVFSVFAFMWHFLVIFVIISVSRSFTISIRQLMRMMESDGRVYERDYIGVKPMDGADNLLQEYVWLDQEYCDEMEEDQEMESSQQIVVELVQNSTSENRSTETVDAAATLSSNSAPPLSANTSSVPPSAAASMRGRGASYSEGTGPQNQKLLSNDEILYHTWKIQSGLRVFGLATQRWMLSLVSVITAWLVINLGIWLKESPSLVDLTNLILPLLILPLLAATFAEVNFEGERLVKFIAPCEERLSILFFLQASPPQLSIFGFAFNYQTIATAGLGLIIAVASNIFLQEITK